MTDATASSSAPKRMEDIVALCRRRGFIFQSSEIYGGINGFWDYGPLGAQLKRNLKDAWWNDIVHGHMPGPDGEPVHIVPVDTTIIMHPKVWQASGHVAGFNDPMVDDKETKQRFRADHLQGLHYVSGGTDEIDEIMRETVELAKKYNYDEAIPVATIVASSEEEALQIFESDKKLQKNLRVSLIKSLQDNGEPCAVVALDLGNNNVQGAIVRPVPLGQQVRDYKKIPSPFTYKPGSLTEPRAFNLMFETYIGAIRDEDAKAYLRPETAQGIFTQFWNVVDSSRVKVPFGIAQQGKAFRNEVTPRNFTFRSREFEQMEIEFFIPDPEAVGEEAAQTREWYEYWRDARYAWWQSIGLAGDNLQLREHDPDELAHYAKEGAGTSDIEYRFPFTAPGFGELEGVAHRTNYDLRQHAEHCGKGDKLRYFDQDRNARYFPHVIEPSAGADRGMLALLCEAYTPDETRASKVFMKFAPRMAPIKAAVFPLVNKDGMPEVAAKLHQQLNRIFPTQFDVKQSIGKRYARMDEAGTPFCFTVDGDTLEDNAVTVRHRDTQHQERIGIDQVLPWLTEKLSE